MEETQIQINLDHHFNLALWCLEPNIHVNAPDTIYIWKLKLVECTWYLFEHLYVVYVRGLDLGNYLILFLEHIGICRNSDSRMLA